MDEIPKLKSFCAFDGIPPQKEGEDPTVFWYYPKDTHEFIKLNQVGLYLTFIWFSRDFKASKDCQFFQTDKTFTCFCCLGANIYCAAEFESTDPEKQKLMLDMMEVFRLVFSVLFSTLTRDSDSTVGQNSEFADNFESLLQIFQQSPELPRLAPSLDIWTICEETIANAKNSMPNVRGAAFIYEDRLVHTTMSSNDTLALYAAYRAKSKRLLDFAPNFVPNTFQWLTGLCVIGNGDQVVTFLPTVYLNDGMVLAAILRYNSLVVFVALLMPKEISKEAFTPLEATLKPALPSIAEMCQAALAADPTPGATAAFRDDSLLQITRPMKLSPVGIGVPEFTRTAVDAAQHHPSDFLRFAGQTDGGRFIFLEKDTRQTTLLETAAKNAPEAVTASVRFINAANLG